MIWNASENTSDASTILARHVTAEVLDHCDASPETRGRIGELVSGVLQYRDARYPGGPVPTQYLTFLLARSLWGIGEHDAAQTYIADHHPAALDDGLDAFLYSSTEFRPPIWELLSCRGVRANRSSSLGEENAWVIDFARVGVPSGGTTLELLVLSLARKAIEAIAPVWDRTDGRGALEIRGTGSVSPDPVDLCREILARRGGQRGWRRTPHVYRSNG